MRLLVIAGICISALPIHADRLWLPKEFFDQIHVVVAVDAPEPEQVAARRFIDHWGYATGITPTLSARPIVRGVNVWIGSAARTTFPEEFDRRRLHADAGLVLTLPRKTTPEAELHLLLAGGDARGTLNAEWAFFERFLGARAFAPGVLHFPEPVEGVPRIEWVEEPVFEYRDSNYRVFLEKPWLASTNDLNGQWSAVPERFGGHIGFVHGLAGHGHTFHHFVNPEEYFDAHPEYFAEIGGERIKYAQLCLTNPDVLAITIDRARCYLREAAPHERILSISQMDYFWFDSWCTCPKCSAVDEEEGSHSGTILRFVNAVADAIQDEFPDALVDTFAYLYSRKPPRLTRPRDNVLIRVCAIEADYGRPLRDWRSPDNRAFVRDLKAWRKIAKHLYVWDYTQNWRAFQAPHPNLHVLQPNLALYAKLRVDGVFEQASPYSPHSDFEFLKAYLIGRGLRDPNFDWERESSAFIDAYYGKAAPYIAEYQSLLRDRLRAWGGPLYFVNDLEWLDADTVEHAQDIFARAFVSVKDDAVAERLRAAYLPVQYAALVCPPRVAQTPDAYIFTRPPSQTFDEYWATLQALGVTHLNDHPIEQLRTRLNRETPPRREVAPIEKLRNDRFEVWIVPARGGAVVRWREFATGREWLAGYDNIRSTSGRLQVWATTDDDRWTEPEPLDQQYHVVDRDARSVTLEIRLDNGLLIRKQIDLNDNGLETRVSLQNSSTNLTIPKVALVAEFATRGGRVSLQSKWADDNGSRGRSPSQDPPPHAIVFRVPGADRTIAAEITEGVPGDVVKFARESRESLVRVDVKLDRAPLASGETREWIIRHSITQKKSNPATPAP